MICITHTLLRTIADRDHCGATIVLIIASGTGILAFRYISTTKLSQDTFTANSIARESIEAVQVIAYDDWSNLSDGTHGIAINAGTWSFRVFLIFWSNDLSDPSL